MSPWNVLMMDTFDKELRDEIKKTLAKYPRAESAILPCLHLVQNRFGYIKDDFIEELSREIDVPADYIFGTATFYTMFNLKPVGKYRLQVCKNISCSLMGSVSLVEYLQEKLDIKAGQATADGKFSLFLVECLGACGGAPVIMVNDEYHENMTVTKLEKLLAECR